MKEKLKKLIIENKKGIYLSLGVFVYQSLRLISRWLVLLSFTIMCAKLCGLVAPMEESLVVMTIIFIVLITVQFLSIVKSYYDYVKIYRLIELFILLFVFIGAVEKHPSDLMATHATNVTMLLALVYFLIEGISPHVFKYLLYKKVINKDYLGIRKINSDKMPDQNIFTDYKSNDFKERMNQMNSHSVKMPYHKFVSLRHVDIQEKISFDYPNVKRDNQIFKMTFHVFPFGLTSIAHHLITLKTNFHDASIVLAQEQPLKLKK